MKVSIGWVIQQRIHALGHHNLRVYKTEGLAKRYSNGLPVLEAFVELDKPTG